MTFVADRYTTASTWILNPRLFWLGRDLQEFLQLNPRPAWSYSSDYRAVLSPSIQAKIDENKSIYTELELNSPSNLWQVFADGFILDNIFTKLNSLKSPKSKSWLFRNVYSEEFLRSWLASDAIVSNEPTEDNTSYGKFIEQLLERISRGGSSNLKLSLQSSSWKFIFITSLPDLFINRSRLKSFISIDNEALYMNDGLSEVVDVGQHPSIQSVTHELLPPNMVNPDWLYTVGWYDLWAGPQSLNNPSGVVGQHDCIFCSAGDIYCSSCDSGQSECGECGGDYYSYCGDCDEGWIQCNECDGDGQQLCDDCDGEGQVDCDDCNGAGDVECEECEGTAELTQCPACEGTGWEGGSSNEAMDNTCGECEGEGETDAFPCPTCEAGRIECPESCDEDGQVECNECDGDGQNTCTNCDGDGGSYCERYECNDGVIYCEYCDEGYQECGECEGYYEKGTCPQMHYEEIWGESIDSSLQNLVTKNGRRRKLDNLMANVKLLPTENASINLLQEVYGDVRFEFKTMAEIWAQFLKIMKQESQESIYFFNPTKNGITIQYASFSYDETVEFVLGDLLVLTRRMIESVYEGDTEYIYNVKPHTGTNKVDQQIRMRKFQKVSIRGPLSSTQKNFLTLFGIQVETEDLNYWMCFFYYFLDFLEPLGEIINSGRISSDFKFLVGTASNSTKIITFNHPKG